MSVKEDSFYRNHTLRKRLIIDVGSGRILKATRDLEEHERVDVVIIVEKSINGTRYLEPKMFAKRHGKGLTPVNPRNVFVSGEYGYDVLARARKRYMIEEHWPTPKRG